MSWKIVFSVGSIERLSYWLTSFDRKLLVEFIALFKNKFARRTKGSTKTHGGSFVMKAIWSGNFILCLGQPTVNRFCPPLQQISHFYCHCSKAHSEMEVLEYILYYLISVVWSWVDEIIKLLDLKKNHLWFLNCHPLSTKSRGLTPTLLFNQWS